MRKLVFTVLLAAALLLIVTVVMAQPVQGITINGIDDSEFPLLRLLVTVTDSDGRPVLGLTEPDFEALAAGRAAQVVEVEEIRNAELGVSVVLVLDSSESMFGAPLENTTNAANILLANLRPTDEVAIIDFDSGFRVLQPFTTDVTAARAAVASINGGGVTSLYDAAYAGVEFAIEQASNPRRFVVLVTDGHEFGGLSTRAAQDAISLASANNIPVFAVGFGSVFEPYLRQLGSAGDGETYILPSSDQLGSIFDFIANFLRSQYIVTIDSGLEPDGSPAPISLSSGSASTVRGYTTPDLYPTPSLGGIPAEPIAEPTVLQVGASAPRGLAQTLVSVDGSAVEPVDGTANVDNTEFSAALPIDPLQFAPGTHTVTVEAVDLLGARRSISQVFTVAELPLILEAGGITEGETIAADDVRTVTASIMQSQGAVAQVAFAVDGRVIEIDTEAPYQADVIMAQLEPGPHLVTVTARNAFEQQAQATLAFVIPAPTPTATPTFTATPVPPTATPIPPTATPVPPTATPTEVPPTATATLRPLTFSLHGIELGEVVADGARAVRVTLDVGVAVSEVVFALDGEQIDRDIAAPYVTTINMGELAPGAHVLDVTVSGADGQTASQQIPFTVPEAPAPTARTPIVVQPPVISTETPIPPTATPATPTEVPPTAAATLVPLTFGLRGVELGEVVADGARAVRVTPDEGIEVASVVFTLDGEEIDRDEAAPYVTTINMGELAPGAHVIDIALTAADGQTASQQVPFTVPEVSAQAARTPVVVETPVLSTETPIPPTETPATPTEEAPTATEVLPTETATEPPPTETPTEVAATAVPQVALGFSFTGLTAGEVIEDETREVEIVPAEGVEIASAAFSLDGTAIGTDDEAPFSAVINTANLEAGVHTFSATVTDANGGSLTQDVEFSIPARTVISDLLLIACGTLLLFLLIAAALVVSRRRRS